MFSIIIPAHNEASVIHRCLNALIPDGKDTAPAEILVVCNGCRDKTAEIANSFSAVRVIEISVASKIAALNAGDEKASYGSRVYLDADITTGMSDLLKVMEELNANSNTQVAAPSPSIQLSHSSYAVKAFYKIWMRLPYFKKNQMIGSGVFALSSEGRQRFDKFPNVISDDGFVRSLFTGDERQTLTNCSFTIFAPKTLKDLIKIKTRVRLGNKEINARFPTADIGQDNSPREFLRLALTNPQLIPAAFIYAYVQFKTKRLSEHRFKSGDFGHWDRDDSSRNISS